MTARCTNVIRLRQLQISKALHYYLSVGHQLIHKRWVL